MHDGIYRVGLSRQSSRGTNAALAALCCLLALATAPPAVAANNILFIVIDDMRHDPQAITPHIDALAQQSTRFNNAYVSVPVCLGSRATLLTGLKPSTHRLGLSGFDFKKQSSVFGNPDIRTLPRILSAGGYLTATMGKVEHKPKPRNWDVAQPYQSITGLVAGLDPGEDLTFLHAKVLAADAVHPDQAVADWAVDFIDNYENDKPFFLAIGFEQPHQPWVLPQWAYELYSAGVTAHQASPAELDDEPAQAKYLAQRPIFYGSSTQFELVEKAGKAQDYTRAYLAATSHTDAMVGQVLHALARSPHAGSTDIVLLSDHGYHLGEKQHWRKATFWQEAVRAPLYIRSSALPAGDVDTPVSFLDVPPTLLALAELPPEPQFEGVSLTAGASPVEIYYANGVATIRGDIKTIDYDLDIPGNSDRAAYNLSLDPGETTNLLHGPTDLPALDQSNSKPDPATGTAPASP